MFYNLLFLSLVLLSSGCAKHKISKTTTNYQKTTKTDKTTKSISNNYKTQAIYKEYKKWDNTPYKYGGKDFRGVDCSALIQSVYKNAFGIDIPRTTIEQIKVGYKINKNSNQSGDLIFFKTSYKDRHIGIIIEKGKFLHSSSKYGVIISSINNPYWKSNYLQTRRILP